MVKGVGTTAAKEEDFRYRLWRYDGAPGELIPLLQSAQDHFGYIPRRAISYIAEVTGIPESEVYGVITFYSQFRLQPMGTYVIRACAGTACHVSSADMIRETIEDELGIEVGGTTEDGLFTLNTVACIGCCSLAPVIMINNDTHGRLTPAKVRKLLRSYRRRERSAGAKEVASGCTETT
jgi:NADH-quinone oxidoreductase subunit E